MYNQYQLLGTIIPFGFIYLFIYLSLYLFISITAEHKVSFFIFG